MKNSLSFDKRAVAAIVMVAAVFVIVFLKSGSGQSTKNNLSQEQGLASHVLQSEATVDLKPSQLDAIKIEPVGTYRFPVEKEAVGTIAYDEGVPARNAQPGSASGNQSVEDLSIKCILANVSESDSPFIHVGQPVEAKVVAYPGRVFEGRISALGGSTWDLGGNPAVDPNTRRIRVRCEIADPKNELYPGMLATIVIQVQEPVESVAIPMNGVVRNGDGTMTAWVTTDRHRFSQRTIKIGLQIDSQYQVLEGLQRGEMAVTDGAVFLSNILNAPPTD